MKILFFDIETTGLNREYNEIINLSAVVYDDQTCTIGEAFDQLIKPKRGYIPSEITAITGITNNMVRNSQCEGIVLYSFMNWAYSQGCSIVAGHNINRFDIPFIKSRCKSLSVPYLLPDQQLDTLNLAKDIYKDGGLNGYNYTTERGNVSFKLEYLADFYGLGKQTHRSLDDVMQNIVVYKQLKKAEDNIDYGF